MSPGAQWILGCRTISKKVSMTLQKTKRLGACFRRNLKYGSMIRVEEANYSFQGDFKGSGRTMLDDFFSGETSELSYVRFYELTSKTSKPPDQPGVVLLLILDICAVWRSFEIFFLEREIIVSHLNSSPLTAHTDRGTWERIHEFERRL